MKASWAKRASTSRSPCLVQHGHRQRDLVPQRLLVADARVERRLDVRPDYYPSGEELFQLGSEPTTATTTTPRTTR